MMNDCQNVEIRETLPELAHGALPERDAERVRVHVAACADCASELAIIQSVLAARAHAMRATPTIDARRIAAAIPAYRTRSRFSAARLQLAAAALIGAVGISALVVQRNGGRDASVAPVTATAVAPKGVALIGTADVSDANLAQLINDLGQLDAVPPAEPEPVTPVALENGGGA